ncbi:Hypothetical predicted protein [Octopus vulgaris]|uniref:Uncharacterized protein n=1 Tax=Octopus vulgaris TaxID=6645 RepID=A0AA36B9E4_OCTVU|nr:Hypothetical predicted protein [Octopus vulgaris]
MVRFSGGASPVADLVVSLAVAENAVSFFDVVVVDLSLVDVVVASAAATEVFEDFPPEWLRCGGKCLAA